MFWFFDHRMLTVFCTHKHSGLVYREYLLNTLCIESDSYSKSLDRLFYLGFQGPHKSFVL